MVAAKDKIALDVPGIWIDRFGPELTIVRSWRTRYAAVQFAGLAFWSLIVWTLIVGMILQGHAKGLLALPVLFLHAALATCFGYGRLCRLVNRTLIRVSMSEISVRHGPLPWLGNKRLPTAGILQLFCVETKLSRKDFNSHAYDVMVWYRDDSQEELVSGIENEQQALLIEREVERRLNLTKERTPPGYERRTMRFAG